MIYKPSSERYWMAKWKHRGEVIRRSTGETNKNAAYRAAERLKSDFHKEQEQIEKAATFFNCDPEVLTYCPECNRLFRSDRPFIAVDGTKLCQEICRDTWNKRCRRVPMLPDFLKNDFLSSFANSKKKSRAYYEYGASQLIESAMAKLRLDEITSQHARQFVATNSPRLSPSTINCGLRTLRHALNLAEEWGKLDRAPRIRLAEGERRRDRVVSDTEFAVYVAVSEEPWRTVALLIRYEGLRPSEAYSLRWENISLHEGLIFVVEGKTPAARRRLPMTTEVYAALLERHRHQGRPKSGWVFPSNSPSGHVEQGSAKNHHQKATKILTTISAIYQQWKKKGSKGNWVKAAAQKASVEISFIERNLAVFENPWQRFVPYSLRHTALTKLAQSGCDAFTLAKIGGHSSIAITQRYVHPQAEAIDRAFANLPSHSVVVDANRRGSLAGVTREVGAVSTVQAENPQPAHK